MQKNSAAEQKTIKAGCCDFYFLFGKHYGRRYSDVHHTDPSYVRSLEYLVRTILREEGEALSGAKATLVKDCVDYLQWVRNQSNKSRDKTESLRPEPPQSPRSE